MKNSNHTPHLEKARKNLQKLRGEKSVTPQVPTPRKQPENETPANVPGLQKARKNLEAMRTQHQPPHRQATGNRQPYTGPVLHGKNGKSRPMTPEEVAELENAYSG